MTATSAIAVVQAEPESRLEALAAQYDEAKSAAEAAAARLKDITDAIKLELTNAAPGAPKVDLVSSALSAPLRLSAVTSWRLDTKRMKAEAPDTYVRFAVQSTSWRLERAK